MSREQFQRLALVVLVVLLAALASDRLMGMVRPPFGDHPDRCIRVRVSDVGVVVSPAVAPLPPMPPLPGVQADVAAEARRMAEEARRHAEEMRQMAEEHRRMAEQQHQMMGDRCPVAQ